MFDFTVTGPTSYSPSITTAGGMGIFGGATVSPGTYSIQETLLANWSLTTATCNDGSSSFSVDTVSGIVINADDIIECTFENSFFTTEPEQVTGLVATATGDTTILLSWNIPGDGGEPITGYTIERESPIGGGFTILVADTGSTETSFEDAALMPDTQYNYRVSAINSVGTGLASNEADATTILFPSTLEIIKLTTGGDDTFDFTVTGPTSYNPSINTASGGAVVEPDYKSVPMISILPGVVEINSLTVMPESGIIGVQSPNIMTVGMNITSMSLFIDGSGYSSGTIQAIILSNITGTNNYEDIQVEGVSNTVDLTTTDFDTPTFFTFNPPVNVADDNELFFGFNFTTDGSSQIDFLTSSEYDQSNVGNCYGVTQIVGAAWFDPCTTDLGSDNIAMEVNIKLDSPVPNFKVTGGIAPSNLITYLTFDDNTDASVDDQNLLLKTNTGTLGHNGSSVNMISGADIGIFPETGIFDEAVSIDAESENYVQITSLENIRDFNFLADDSTDSYGISFWIKSSDFSSLTENLPLLSNMGQDESAGLRIMVENRGVTNEVVVDIANDSGLPIANLNSSSNPAVDDTWMQVGLTVDKSDIENVNVILYVNGDFENQVNADFISGFSNTIEQMPLAVGEFIGSSNWAGKTAERINFLMDDLCIWKGYLPTASDMATIWNAGSGSTCSNVVSNTSGGMGIDGPTTVNVGTYSIQESLPVGWTLSTATCNDGSSSFSVDTVSGIEVVPSANIECTFENEFGAPSPDTDGDGIYDNVDTLPNSASNDFSDIGIGGTTLGTITTRGDQILAITDEPNPDGVRIVAELSGGILPASGDACGGIANILMTAGDDIVVTCGSIRIDVTNGPVEVTFFGTGGMQATTTLTQGNSLTFSPDEFSFVVPSTNTDAVVIIVDGEQIILEPGQAANVLSSNKDSFLKQGESNTNEGISTMTRVRADGHNRALVSFDQVEILSASQYKTLSSATMRLYIEDNGNNWGTEGRTIDIHRLLEDWTEGNGFNDKPSTMILSEFNALKVRGDGLGVTWKCSTDSEINNQQSDCDPQWNGASYSQTPTSTVTIFKDNPPTGTVKTIGWIEFDVTSDVQTFLSDSEQNYGWIIKKTEEGTAGSVEFSSGQASANMPELVLVFE